MRIGGRKLWPINLQLHDVWFQFFPYKTTIPTKVLYKLGLLSEVDYCLLIAHNFIESYGMFTGSSLKTNDYCAIPQQLKGQLNERYPEARRAYLKTGGAFPFLSRPDELNLHLQVDTLSIFALYIYIYIWRERDWSLPGNICILLIGYLRNVAAPAKILGWSSTGLGPPYS